MIMKIFSPKMVIITSTPGNEVNVFGDFSKSCMSQSFLFRSVVISDMDVIFKGYFWDIVVSRVYIRMYAEVKYNLKAYDFPRCEGADNK
jgi:methionine salvage enolase-phosphatase E1